MDEKIETIKVRPRQECPDCKKHFRKLQRCRDKIKRCAHCKKAQITNKFYVTLKERKNFEGTIGKFSMTTKERILLHRKFMDEGLDSEHAWKKVNTHTRMLRGVGRRKRWSDHDRRKFFAMKERERKDDKRKFLEGLK